MIATAEPRSLREAASEPTLWGLTPTALHDRYWAAQGLCVVRRGEPGGLASSTSPAAFLLISPLSLVLFKLPVPMPTLLWTAPKLAVARVVDEEDCRVCETVVSNADHSFVRIDRFRQRRRADLSRIVITTSREIALAWQSPADHGQSWRQLRRAAERNGNAPHAAVPRIIPGFFYDREDAEEVDDFARSLPQFWSSPSATIQGIECSDSRVWKTFNADVAMSARIIGSVWIGAGRSIGEHEVIAGPAVLWDEPGASSGGRFHLPVASKAHAPAKSSVQRRLRATTGVESPVVLRRRSRAERALKRSFDFLLALVLLIMTLPVSLMIVAAIWLYDGRPAVVARRRQTLRGREFNCWKFRVLHNESEKLAAAMRNQSEFYPRNDPRLTPAGRVLRRLRMDEIPQLVNVLAGHMAIVGPRPGPQCDDQGNSSWREARLSVRPGMTGLWRIMPTRQRGADFHEWGRYDVQYVESGGLLMDLRILARTFARLVF